MKTSKLLKLLKLLSKTQVKKLIEFISIPYFNKDAKAIQLIDFLSKKAPVYSFDKEDCFQLLFPNENYDALKLRRLFSKTFKLCEKFLAIECLEEESHVEHQLLARFYKKNVEESLFKEQCKSWENALKKLHWDEQVFEQYNLAQQKWQLLTLLLERSIIPNKREKTRLLFDEIFDSFEQLIFRTLFQLNNKRVILNFNYHYKFGSFPLLDEIFEKFKEEKKHYLEKWKGQALISQTYQSKLHIHDIANEESFLALKKMRDEGISSIPKPVLFDICIIITLYCMRLFSRDKDPFYLEEFYNNFEFQLKHKIMFRNNMFKETFIIPTYFIGMISVGLDLKKIEESEILIEKYHRFLPKEIKKPITLFARASLAFAKKEYAQSVKYLGKMEVNFNFFYFYRCKVLQIKAFYELEEYDVLESLLNSFRVLITRSKQLPTKLKVLGRNFLNAVHLFMQSNKANPKSIEKLHKLKTELNKNHTETLWLKIKLEEKLSEL